MSASKRFPDVRQIGGGVKYLIDYRMLYEVDAALVLLIDEPEVNIKLSNQAGRLLYQLVINSGRELTREALIETVWENQGFTGSSVSLNVAISEIRKVFRQLGHDPGLINTIRKKGFCLNAHVEHHTVRPAARKPEVETWAEANVGFSKPQVVTEATVRRNPAMLMLAILLVAIIAGVGLMLLSWFGNADTFEPTELVFLGQHEQCGLWLIGSRRDPDNPEFLLKAIDHQLSAWQIDCRKNKADVFFSSTEQIVFKNSFTGVCFRNEKDTGYRSCRSLRKLGEIQDIDS